MRMRSVGLLGAAAVFASIAAYLTKVQLSSLPQSVERVVEKQVAIKTTTVVVAARDLPFGTKLAKSDLTKVAWPSKLVPQGVFKTPSVLVKTGAERVVLRPMAKGEPVFQSKVSKPGYRPSLAGTLSSTTSAVTIRVDEVQGVAGFIQPDDRVDVLLTRRAIASNASGSARAYTDILLQNVKVLAVDQRFNRSTANKPARAVTLEVDQIQAQKLVLAANVGRLSLTLKNNTAVSTQKPRRIGLDDLPNSQRPTAPNVVVQAPATAPVERPEPIVTIVRGTAKRESYRVENDRPDGVMQRVETKLQIPRTRSQSTLPNQRNTPNTLDSPRLPAPRRIAPQASGFATAKIENKDSRNRELPFRGEPQ